MNRIQILCLTVIFSLFLSPFTINAQETIPSYFTKEQQELFDKLPKEEQEAIINLGPPSAIGFNNKQITDLENTVNCFDYYTFGSVQVDVSPTIEQTISGVPLTFTGKLKNDNPFPIVNGSVYVKIFKLEGVDGPETHRNGYPLVAFFEAGKDIAIPANDEQDFTFDWQVPLSLQGGDYEANFFFVTDHRFNLLGLTFTDDVTGNKTEFTITGGSDEQVVFDKDSVTLNEEPYSFVAFPPHLNIDTPAVLKAEVVNPSGIEKTVIVSWDLYNWDALRADSLLDTISETVILKPYEKKEVLYSTSKQTGAVSYIIATVHDGDATSIINSRFVRDGIEEVRLNFPSLYTYPIRVGEENIVFSCVHSTNLPLVRGNELTLTLTDADTEEVIHKYIYEGDITGDMMGIRDSFVPAYVPQRVTLTTTLSRGGEVIDSVSQTYDCNVLTPNDCPTLRATATDDVVGLMSKKNLFFTILSIVSIGVVALIIYRRKRFNVNIITPNDTTV